MGGDGVDLQIPGRAPQGVSGGGAGKSRALHIVAVLHHRRTGKRRVHMLVLTPVCLLHQYDWLGRSQDILTAGVKVADYSLLQVGISGMLGFVQ